MTAGHCRHSYVLTFAGYELVWLVLRAGVEPARPEGTQDFKSCASTNSATPAARKRLARRIWASPRAEEKGARAEVSKGIRERKRDDVSPDRGVVGTGHGIQACASDLAFK